MLGIGGALVRGARFSMNLAIITQYVLACDKSDKSHPILAPKDGAKRTPAEPDPGMKSRGNTQNNYCNILLFIETFRMISSSRIASANIDLIVAENSFD